MEQEPKHEIQAQERVETPELDLEIEHERALIESKAEEVSRAIENVDESRLNEHERSWFGKIRNAWEKTRDLVKDNANIVEAASWLGASLGGITFFGTTMLETLLAANPPATATSMIAVAVGMASFISAGVSMQYINHRKGFEYAESHPKFATKVSEDYKLVGFADLPKLYPGRDTEVGSESMPLWHSITDLIGKEALAANPRLAAHLERSRKEERDYLNSPQYLNRGIV